MSYAGNKIKHRLTKRLRRT